MLMAQEKSAKPLEILVIDDDPSIRIILSRIISDLGTNATTAVGGKDGIEKYIAALDTDKPYNAVFTDLNMPNGNGVDVIRAVKGLSPSIPLYVITGAEINMEYSNLLAQLGDLKLDGMLQKPFIFMDIQKLLESIREITYQTPPPTSQS